LNPEPVNRDDPYWRQFFFEAWRQQLARLPTGNEGLFQGPALAKHSAGLADDAVREALGLAFVPTCKECSGVGCARCAFTGREPSGDSPQTIAPASYPCRACGGTGKKSDIGSDGVVTLSDTEPCPSCKGSGQYAGTMIPAVSPPAPQHPAI